MKRRVRSCALLLSALVLLLTTIFIPVSPVAAGVAENTTEEVTLKLDLSCIRGNIPVYLVIPDELIDRDELGIVYIDETGAVAFLESERVTIEGTVYLRFENNALPAVYGWVG